MNKYIGGASAFLQGQRNQFWLLALVIGLVYLPFLGSEFFFDDIMFFGGAAKYYATSWFKFDLRWFPYASLGWSVRIFSDVVPHFFHLGNALVHFGNVVLLFVLIRRITEAALPDAPRAVIARGALLAALIFAAHPVAVYAVGYVVQRSILMATFFGLLMYWAYLRGTFSGEKRWLLLSIVSYFIACFSKEHSALLPVALAALAMLLNEHNRLEKKTLWLVWLSYLGIFVLVVLRAKGIFGSPYEAMAAQLFEQQGIVAGTPMLYLLSVMTQAGLFFKYLFLWLLPNPDWMSVDMREQFIPGLTAWLGWLGVAGYITYGAVAFRWLLRGGSKGLVGFALLYPWLLFPIEFSSIRVQEPFVLYRSYLWMPGVMLLVPLALLRFPQRRTHLAMVVMVLLLIPLSWGRLWVFADNYRMWDEAARLLENERVAGADRIYFNRGQAEMARQKWQPAALDFERSAAISPQLEPIHYILGVAYANLGRYEDALVQFDLALKIDARDDRVYYAKGMILRALGRGEEAKQQMKTSCELENAVACLILTGEFRRAKTKP
ncbi:lipoprotein NlpI [mine drainage metagenome]|uniref:Lipoprotein NlpI n=1 Tax=mine drainage metagenome TaxID=410659 RepID=A0A1J5SPH0_9ZZZZ